MTATDTEPARRAEVFGCGRGLDLLERLAATPDGIGTPEVSLILGLRSNKWIGSRLRATKTEIESQGIRFEHAVVRTPRSKGSDSTWKTGPRGASGRRGGSEAAPFPCQYRVSFQAF